MRTVDSRGIFNVYTLPPASISELYAHIILTLSLTAIWVYTYRHRSFTFLAIAMFFPSLLAVCIHICRGSLLSFLSFLFITEQWSTTLYWSLIASFSSIVTVILCCLVNYLVGWSPLPKTFPSLGAVHQHNRNLLFGWLRAMGEEIGWRSYLLPGLLAHYHPINAFPIVGLVWGLYHVPVMVLLSYQSNTKVRHPVRTILVQCLSCWISAFVYGWVGIQCRYSFVPPTMAHFVWNQINPLLLGSIYTNTSGWMKGEQWKINGEGLMGCLVYLVAAICIVTFSFDQ